MFLSVHCRVLFWSQPGALALESRVLPQGGPTRALGQGLLVLGQLGQVLVLVRSIRMPFGLGCVHVE